MSSSAIHLHDLHKHYGSVHALRGVSLTVPPGSVGLLGPNGAGKTTLLKLLLGMLVPDSGTASIAGLDPRNAQGRLAIRQKIGYMPESECLVPGMSAVEIVALLGRLSGMPAADAMTRTHEVLDYVGTGEERYRKSDEYSTGMKQRIKLAQALVHDPPILLLDEPTNGLDPKGRRAMLELVSDLGRNQGKNVLLCTHLLPDVGRACDHVIVMNQGLVVQQESIANLTATSATVVEISCEGNLTSFRHGLERAGHAVTSMDGPNFVVTLAAATESSDGLFALAQSAGTIITSLQPKQASLEDAFLDAMNLQGIETKVPAQALAEIEGI